MKRLLVILLISACVLNGCGGKSKPSTPSVVEKIDSPEAAEPPPSEESTEESNSDIVKLYSEDFENSYGDEITFDYSLSDGKRSVLCGYNPNVSNDKDQLYNEMMIYYAMHMFASNSTSKDVDSAFMAGMYDGSKAGSAIMYDASKNKLTVAGGYNRNGDLVLQKDLDWLIELDNVKHDEVIDIEWRDRMSWVESTLDDCFGKIR